MLEYVLSGVALIFSCILIVLIIHKLIRDFVPDEGSHLRAVGLGLIGIVLVVWGILQTLDCVFLVTITVCEADDIHGARIAFYFAFGWLLLGYAPFFIEWTEERKERREEERKEERKKYKYFRK